MENKFTSKGWAKDFNEFLNANESLPPQALSERIFQVVHRDLNPSVWQLFSKLTLIQLIVGSLSLLVCAQFGIGTGPLVYTFARFGDTMCMALCGALFLGLTAAVSLKALSRSEIQLMRTTGYLPILAMGIFSLGIFFGFGADIVAGLAFVWLLGGFISALIVIEASLKVRTWVAANS